VRKPNRLLLTVAGLACVALALLLLARATSWLDGVLPGWILGHPPALPAAAGAVRVVDGDSLEVEGRRVRLLGIDAPELSQSCEGPAEEAIPCGRLAREALLRLVRGSGAGGTLRCREYGEDRFGRVLAVCTLAGGEEVNRALVREGWALNRNDGPGYAREQREAEAARRGIHAWRFQHPADWRRERRR
jgi:endonuclease YncB( thermonuclease family)